MPCHISIWPDYSVGGQHPSQTLTCVRAGYFLPAAAISARATGLLPGHISTGQLLQPHTYIAYPATASGEITLLTSDTNLRQGRVCPASRCYLSKGH
jgi:hypothetical protein